MDFGTAFETLGRAAGDALSMFVGDPPEERRNVSEEAIRDALRAFKAAGAFKGEDPDLDNPEDYAKTRRITLGLFLIPWWLGQGDEWIPEADKREEMVSWIEEMSGVPRDEWQEVTA